MKLTLNKENPENLHIYGKHTFVQERILTGLFGVAESVPEEWSENEGADIPLVGSVTPMTAAIIKPNSNIKKGTVLELLAKDPEEDGKRFCPEVSVTKKSKIKFIFEEDQNAGKKLTVAISGKEVGQMRYLAGAIVHCDPKVNEVLVKTGHSNHSIFFETFSRSATYELVEWKIKK